MTSCGSGSVTPQMTGTPGLMMPAFSRAIEASVLPSWRMWSKLIDVITLTTGRHTLVESSRPPRPTSKMAASACRSTKCKQRHRRREVEVRRPAVGITLGGGFVVHRAGIGFHAIDKRDKLVGSAGLAIDGKPLLDLFEVRRAEQACAIAGRREHRGDHGRG